MEINEAAISNREKVNDWTFDENSKSYISRTIHIRTYESPEFVVTGSMNDTTKLLLVSKEPSGRTYPTDFRKEHLNDFRKLEPGCRMLYFKAHSLENLDLKVILFIKGHTQKSKSSLTDLRVIRII